MVTVQTIFDMAIHILDEQSESSGATQTSDTDEYRFRTISILNSAIPALWPFSESYDPAGEVPTLYADDYKNPDLDQVVEIDDRLALSVLPYFLAAKLIQTENESLAALCMTQYREAFQDLRTRGKGTFERIQTSYGYF